MESWETMLETLPEQARKYWGEFKSSWWRELKAAAAFLTRLPVPLGDGDGALPLSRAVRAFPVVGLGVGALAGVALYLGFLLNLHPLASALAGLAVAAAVTGALHEDGLADVADGFGGGATKEDKLAVMRDSRIGSYGVLALIFSIGLKAAALASFIGPGTAALALIGAAAASRAALPLAMHFLPPARQDGLSHGAGQPDRGHALTAAAVGLAIAWMLFGLTPGLAALLAGSAAVVFVGWLALRQIGGQTGDVLGAQQQAFETAALLAAAAVPVW